MKFRKTQSFLVFSTHFCVKANCYLLEFARSDCKGNLIHYQRLFYFTVYLLVDTCQVLFYFKYIKKERMPKKKITILPHNYSSKYLKPKKVISFQAWLESHIFMFNRNNVPIFLSNKNLKGKILNIFTEQLRIHIGEIYYHYAKDVIVSGSTSFCFKSANWALLHNFWSMGCSRNYWKR